MFDGLTKPKFYTKCKTLIRMTKTRLEAFKKKKMAVIKYLKNDMADLIKSDLAYNAFCRAEGLLAEQTVITCYNFIAQFCGCVSTNLSLMVKNKECPEECKEAVQSLIYAAARFSEFPELRELRAAFSDRYGPSLDAFINKEFVEILKPKAITKEMKIQLMHDVAQEFSIEWNTKSLEQKLFKPPQPQQDEHSGEPLLCADKDGNKQMKEKDGDFATRNSLNDYDGYKLEKNKDKASTKGDSHDLGNKVNDMREHTFPRKYGWSFAYQGRKGASDDRYRLHSSSEDEVFSVSRKESTDQDSVIASSSSVGSVSDDEVDSKKHFSYRLIPPPYRIKTVEKEKEIEEPFWPSSNTAAEAVNRLDDSINESKPKPRSVRRKPLKPPSAHENFDSVERPLKPPPGRNRVGSVESEAPAKANSSAMKVEQHRRGLRLSEGDDNSRRDEEENIIDGLLMHYSKKDSSPEPNKLSSYLEPPSSRHINDDVNAITSHRNAISELPHPPGRASNLGEPAVSTDTTRPTRAGSAPPDIVTGRVHAILPDYDELAARIAALKGR